MAASASSPKFSLSDPTSGTSTDIPTEQGYEDLPLPSSLESLLLTRRPGDDKGIEYCKKLMNEHQARFEQQIHEVLTKLWPKPHDPLSQQWPPMYVMKAQLESQFLQWHEDNPIDELKPRLQGN